MSPHAEHDQNETGGITGNDQKPQTTTNRIPKKTKSKGKRKTDAQNQERIQRLDQLYSKEKRKTHFVPTPKSDIEHASQASHVVLKVRRIICDKGFPTGTEIDIKSELLENALSDIFEGVEGLQLNETPPVISPELLFHARNGLHKRVESEKGKSTPNKALVDELGVALEYIKSDYASTLESLSSLAKHDEITFDLLWTLFPPNAKVYTKDNLLRQQQVLKLQKGVYARRQNGSRYYSMDVVFIAHDGEKLGWIENNLTIEAFDGAKKVCSLSCVPLDQLPERDLICKQLGQRGQRYLELLSTPSGTYQEYLGPALTENRDVIVDDQFKKVTLHVSGRIMLDNLTFAQQNKYTDLLKPGVTDEIPGSYMTTTSMSENDRLYCNHAIGGFAFRQKKWCMFPISDPHPVVWNADAFSKLVMDTKKRNLIHSLVKSHKHGPESFDDVVAGKGKGLVGLLSGSPGVGKTLTAEVIAEVTKRPLYMLSAGELGTCMDIVEEKLDMVLEMTRQWGCVLLIDEADVFLQERDGLDLERNALVSVFLRRLEYFQGVLIMTTNRKRTIDAAFDSRIHFKLHYQELDSESRYTIWKNCLENTPAGLEKGDIGEENVRKLAGLRLNGRQIKNAVACAVSIAVEEKEALTIDGIHVILDMVLDTDGTD